MAIITRTSPTKASGTITVTNFALAVNGQVTIAGEPPLNEGSSWFAATDNDTTAASLCDAINSEIPEVDATVVGSVITVVAASAGVAGNSITMELGIVTLGLSISGDTLTGGTAGSLSNPLVNTGPTRVNSVTVKSTGTALDVTLLDGLDSGGTEFDVITGTTGKTVARSYDGGLVLKTGCYVTFGADVTQAVINFDAI